MFVNAAPFPHDLLVIIADHHTIFLIGSCYYCFLKNREQLHTQVFKLTQKLIQCSTLFGKRMYRKVAIGYFNLFQFLNNKISGFAQDSDIDVASV